MLVCFWAGAAAFGWLRDLFLTSSWRGVPRRVQLLVGRLQLGRCLVALSDVDLFAAMRKRGALQIRSQSRACAPAHARACPRLSATVLSVWRVSLRRFVGGLDAGMLCKKAGNAAQPHCQPHATKHRCNRIAEVLRNCNCASLDYCCGFSVLDRMSTCLPTPQLSNMAQCNAL